MASILVVDDDSNILYFLSKVLGLSKHELVLANGGQEALQHIAANDFDLIISDLQMPAVSGFEVLQAGKNKNPHTAVLILTAYGSIKSAVRAMKLGAFEYLSKPIDVEELRLKVEQALEHRTLKIKIEQQQKKLDEYHEMIQRDLRLAEQVQQSLVPLPICNEVIDMGLRHQPIIGVGGDFADIYYDGKQQLYISMIDITGHGITAALLVNRICSEIRNLVRDELEPRAILYQVNNFIIDMFHRTGMFLTMFSGKIDFQQHTFTYAGSAHPPLIYYQKKTGDFLKLSSQNIIIGFEKQQLPAFGQDRLPLAAGDQLFFYTDGIIEAENGQREPFGFERLQQVIQQNIQQAPQEIVDTVVNHLAEHNFTQVRDDIFVIAARLK